MAQQTMTLNCTASAFISSESPNTNAHGSGSYNIYDYLNAKSVLLGFDAFPASLSKKIIYSFTFAFTGQASITDFSYYAWAYEDTFNENTVTYLTAPTSGTRFDSFEPSSTSTERYSKARTYLPARYVKCRTISVGAVFTRSHYGSSVNVYTRNAASANRPVITVVYDDTLNATRS